MPPGFKKPENETTTPVTQQEEVQMILARELDPSRAGDVNVIKFILAYVKCRNAADASREAGLEVKAGKYLKQLPDVYRAINALAVRNAMKFGFDAHEVVERFKEIADVDWLDFYNDDGSVRAMKDIPPHARRALKKIKIRETWERDPNGMTVKSGEILEFELWDKMKANELLGREEDLFAEKRKVEHDVGKNMSNILLDSRRRAEERRAEIRGEELSSPIEISGRVIDVTEEKTS